MLLTKGLSIYFFACKGPSNGVGVSRDTVLQEIRLGVGLKYRRFRSRKVGGATVERLFRSR